MEVKKYIEIVVNNLLLIVLITLFTTMLTAYLVLFRIAPVYESSASLYVMENDLSSGQYTDMTVIKQLVKDYQSILSSRMITDMVEKSVGLKSDEVSDITRNVYVSQQGDANIIVLKVRNKSPKMAQNITENFSKLFIEKISDISTVKNVTVKAIDKPELPKMPITPRNKLDIAVAFMLSFTASLGIVFLKEYFDTSLKTVEDVEKYLNLKVLGTIPVRNIK
ncbi:Capsular polysaccharide biosynthesis protein [Clostridium acidisoli DSM 12555]|jgi:capsular polysaccharide biosynthesis protein|uniref:Capsular polysaccharide biosynthesis protein n=1 Tax=Clostridium acidisoli DSM 12555 TaxID=1121291 RepID=A0A1W1X2U8_9CLOT|nr:Wzz/FepE/Etk N-terminal domain-containing protein [Clostridium acidisoli]SMC18272.1 Capsular polysaccharide biosynthesis protein [Clostridium acidisoli DSM 12555]